MMFARSLWWHPWRRLVDMLMLRTFGYEHADVNRWWARIHELSWQVERSSPHNPVMTATQHKSADNKGESK